MHSLRIYQERLIGEAAKKVAFGKRKIILQAPTGAGKSVIFAALIARYLNKNTKKVLIVCHREKLVKQSRSTLLKWYGIQSEGVFAESKNLNFARVYSGMAETLYRRFSKSPNYIKNIGLIVTDEAHLGLFEKLYEHIPDVIIIGFTATPLAASKLKPLKSVYEDIVCGPQINDLIAEYSLTRNKTYRIANIDRSKLKVKGGDFDDTYMGNIMSGGRHVQNTLSGYQKYCLGRKTIIFNCNIEHSKVVNDAFCSYGYLSRHLDGYMPKHEAEAILKWFEETPGAILNNVAVATTGFDIPDISAVIVNKGTKSLPLFLQMCGRGSRICDNKKDFIILDMAANTTDHGDWSDDRDWHSMFHFPEKAGKGGEAPVKECVSCKVIIHLSQKICPHCGALNTKPVKYDEGIVKFELLSSQKPIEINVQQLINEQAGKVKSDGTPYKDISVLHTIKYKIIIHAQMIWRLKKIDDKTAYKLIDLYEARVKDWVAIKGDKYGWCNKVAKEWMTLELKRAFNWEPVKLTA